MRFAMKPWFIKVWHAPEHFRILDPLPPAHRRGIIACAVAISVCFLWPVTPPKSEPKVIPLTHEATQPLQANLVTLPDSADEKINSTRSYPATSEESIQNTASENQWHTYHIAPGQTLAQLFRDNNLPPNDVYAMAQVEGNDKPLSNLQAGQTVHIRKNANGVVTGLSIENEKGNKQVHFTRQQDGSFRLGR